VQDFSGELQKFSGEVRISPQNPAMFDKYSWVFFLYHEL
jgi:hypothetical protein